MLALMPTTHKQLVRVVSGLTQDLSLREDLLQEALIHFWKRERQLPGQSLSWYLQSCCFHVRHCLSSGRSVDSSKRRRRLIDWPEDEDSCEWLVSSQADGSVRAQVHVREIIQLLSRDLTPRELVILQCLAEELGLREIARRVNFSHPTVLKIRRHIAERAAKLGVARPTPHRRRTRRPVPKVKCTRDA